MSQENIDRAKAHQAHCLYKLSITEAFWHEHNIPPIKSKVIVTHEGIAQATINGTRYYGRVPNYDLVQKLDAAAASGSIEEMEAIKTAIKPHAFEIVFEPHHHLPSQILKPKPIVVESIVTPQVETPKLERTVQAVQARPELPVQVIAEQIGVSPQTVRNAKKKIQQTQKEQVASEQSSMPEHKSPEQRIAHRAKPFLPA
jgi:hypothetical protein